MIEDMTMHKLAEQTHPGYIRAVKNFTRFFGRSPDEASAEDLRKFQLHMVSMGVSRTTINATISTHRGTAVWPHFCYLFNCRVGW
jgi:site-specific recombinase XerD